MTVDQTIGEVNRLRDQLKVLAKERAEDLESISDLVSSSQKKTLGDLERTKQHLESFIRSQREDLMQHQIDVKEELSLKIDTEIGDKVRVDEVQDALRRLTESF